MKKSGKLIILLFLIVQCFNALAQKPKVNKLIGLWQINTPQIADALLANYRFFKDGTFVYTFNSYDDRGRIREARGTYKLIADTLTIVVKSRKELVGGDLIQGGAGSQQEELVLDGAKMVEIKQKEVDPIRFIIHWFVKGGVRGLILQNNKYFLVSTDPHNSEN